jgi:hypothetical protein
MFSSNESLKYVDYAYQALAKSCKLIPVMIGSILIEGTVYSWTKYASVAGMTAGITAYEFMKDAGGGVYQLIADIFGAADDEFLDLEPELGAAHLGAEHELAVETGGGVGAVGLEKIDGGEDAAGPKDEAA